jgi:hypothetical protein
MTKINDINKEILKQLQYYSREISEKVEEAKEETAKKLVENLKRGSPENRPEYSKGWRIKKEKKKLIVHNKTNYQLTHLLEKGHALRDGGREPAQVHIKPNEEKAVKDYLQKIERLVEE